MESVRVWEDRQRGRKECDEGCVALRLPDERLSEDGGIGAEFKNWIDPGNVVVFLLGGVTASHIPLLPPPRLTSIHLLLLLWLLTFSRRVFVVVHPRARLSGNGWNGDTTRHPVDELFTVSVPMYV